MNQKYAILLWKCLKTTADAAGIKTPENAETKSWRIRGRKPEDLIYSATLSADSAEMVKEYGHATLDSAHYEDEHGGQSHLHVLWYHGQKAHIPIGGSRVAALRKFKVPYVNGNPDMFFQKKGFYPLWDAENKVVKALTEAGKIKITEMKEGPLAGRMTAEVALPDELFDELVEPLYYGYLGDMGATLLAKTIDNDGICNYKILKEDLGEGRYDIFLKHFHTICENTVRCVKVVEDSNGLALIPHRDRGKRRPFTWTPYTKNGAWEFRATRRKT